MSISDTEDKAPDPNSKSQRKRDMIALQELGKELTALAPAILEKCELPEFLADAIAQYKALPKKHGAQNRQMQYIGKMMRELDDETLESISAHITENVSLAKRRFHLLEEERDKLLAGGKDAIADYINQYPNADIQLINQLVRQANKEQEQQAPPAASRRLFQLLRDQAGI